MLYDWIIDSIHTVLKNGLTLSSLVAVLFLLLKNRKLKRYINRHLPRMLRDRDEDKLDYIIRLLEGRPCVNSNQSKSSATNVKMQSMSHSPERSVVHTVMRFTIYPIMRRMKKMKTYLKKLGRTKFQALLVSLIVNIVSAVLFMSGTLDIDGVINMWMPIINMTIGTISTWVYIIVEGSIDKEAQRQNVFVVNQEGGRSSDEVITPAESTK